MYPFIYEENKQLCEKTAKGIKKSSCVSTTPPPPPPPPPSPSPPSPPPPPPPPPPLNVVLHHPFTMMLAEPTGSGVSGEYNSRKEPDPPHLGETFQSEQTYFPDEREAMPSCDDCGVVLESVPELARHMNRWGLENNDLKRKREKEDEAIPLKKSM
ncbi:Hypothetical predicted protein [Mytilus galloprovincialis]|uniref:Uncharacterized protein n=1 Tax=Mytilus galloprovincialis TaxID=29158 RepID=A0A8B6HG74_MYTGA|nr:Hypothetical predicted protein [Mytilus galloprovincialis]